MRITTATAALAALILLGAGCRSTAPDATPAAQPPASLEETRVIAPPPEAPPTNVEPTTPPPGTAASSTEPAPRIIRISAKMWEFVPSEIRVRKGERVVLEVTSADVPHGFSIPEYGISRTLAPGVTERIVLTADKAGSFTASCSVYCGDGHRQMRATLVVE